VDIINWSGIFDQATRERQHGQQPTAATSRLARLCH